MAEDLGKRLVAEIETVGLDEILDALRHQDEAETSYFGVPGIDRLLSAVLEARPPRTKTRPTSPVLELTTLAPGGGATHLLYHLTATAVLPAHLGGKGACAVILDTDDRFSVERLAQQLSWCLHSGGPNGTAPGSDLQETICSALQHVHICRPPSLASAVATLEALPTYLFSGTQHASFDRSVAFVALDSASAFAWQARAEEEADEASQPSRAPHRRPARSYAQLATALRSVSASLACPLIVTSRHLGSLLPTTSQPGAASRVLRPSLPAPFAQLPHLRLLVQRVPVRKFAPGMSIAEARRESHARQEVVDAGRFECVVNEWAVDERTRLALQSAGRLGFGFRITDEGVVCESD